MRYLTLICFLLLPLSSFAAGMDELALLRHEIEALASRIGVLERENKRLRQETESKAYTGKLPDPLSNVADDSAIRVEGDFRVRYETIDLSESETQERARIRARASVARNISGNTELGIGIATGGSSPTSSTQTLGDGGGKKAITLDLAYVDWQPFENVHVLAGKFRNHLFKVPSQTILWDDEWRPEGIGFGYDNGRQFASLLGTWLESDSFAADREFAFGGQAGLHRQFGATRLTAGIGYFDLGVSDAATFHGADRDFYGNTFECFDAMDDATCVYQNDYRELEIFSAIDFELDRYSASVYAHFVRNIDADRFNEGWTVGSNLQIPVDGQTVSLNYNYKKVEADAVFGLLTDSDFGGGGTNVSGHHFKAGWSMTQNLVFSIAYFNNDVGISQNDDNDYSRVQLNADFRY